MEHVSELRSLPRTATRVDAKRVFDIIVAATLLVLLAPLMVVISIGIVLDSPGSPIWVQTRVGRQGRLFRLLKFRSMIPDAHRQRPTLMETHPECDPRQFKCPRDPRVTPVGAWLRRWSLDELPQLWNVLVGDMSLVGPRPPLPEEVALYSDWHRQRLLITPGLTGLWQVSGRSDLSFDEMVRLDLYYAEHQSLWFDLRILVRTVPAVLSGRGAY
jgi:lipopolysaccharide/colanic/teichoic acid biosynthesis glycosyltransferase